MIRNFGYESRNQFSDLATRNPAESAVPEDHLP